MLTNFYGVSSYPPLLDLCPTLLLFLATMALDTAP